MISIVMATHNGAPTLPRTLAALEQIERPAQGLEILAVDNASTDETCRILDAHSTALPIRVLREPRRGKSFALNRGIESARGELIVFTDDDVISAANWLVAFAEAARRHPEVRVFAGQVRHVWDAPPPRWLEELAASGQSYGGTPGHLGAGPAAPALAKGANFMVRRSALGTVRFAEDEGVNFTGQDLSVGGEDTRLVRDLVGANGTVFFVPEACVRHIVRAHQVGVRPVFERYLRIGGTLPAPSAGKLAVLGYPLRGVGRLARLSAAGLYRLARGQPSEAARRMVDLAMTLGALREARRQRSASPSLPTE